MFYFELSQYSHIYNHLSVHIIKASRRHLVGLSLDVSVLSLGLLPLDYMYAPVWNTPPGGIT